MKRYFIPILSILIKEVKKLRDYLMSLAGGLVVGVIFFVVHLPLPAPPLPGIFGMLGIWLGLGW